MGILMQMPVPATGQFGPHTVARQHTPPGVAVAVAATTKAVPEVRRDVFVFAPAAAQSVVMATLDDAANANDQEAAALKSAQPGAEGAPRSALPPPRRDEADPTAHFIPEPKPLVGPAPARVPILGFEVQRNPVLEETAKTVQAEQAYRSQQRREPDQPAAADAAQQDQQIR